MTVEQSIWIMAQGASDEGIVAVIEAWREYFKILQIPSNKQQEEFDAIIRARLTLGIVSIAAPSIDEIFGGTHRCKCALVEIEDER